MFGCLIGFLFSSYDEEAATIGKVRDLFTGGITGITLVKFRSIEGLLLTFASGPGPQAFALTVAVAVVYSVCGFFAMFLQRELFLNLSLAASRKRRGLLTGGKVAGAVARELLVNAPLNLLLGQMCADDLIGDANKAEREKAFKVLESDEIKEYLKQAETATKEGSLLDWDVVSKVAALQYYLVYAVDSTKRDGQLDLAMDWLTRALIMCPRHPDFEIKLADVLNEKGKNQDAIDLLRIVMTNPQAPVYAMQWLAVYLLAKPGREEESIRLSQKYFEIFPDEYISYFNLARAYASLYNELSASPAVATDSAVASKLDEYRKLTIDNMRKGLAAEPADRLQSSKDWVKDKKAYLKFLEMAEFSALLA